MAITIMGLGPFRFGVANDQITMDRLARRFEYRWEPQMRIGRRPAEQFLGPGEEWIDVRGVLYPHYAGGYGQLNDMRYWAQAGFPAGLASAAGYYYGLFCIRHIRDEQEYFHPNGDPRKVEFSIDLIAYGEEGVGGGSGVGTTAIGPYIG